MELNEVPTLPSIINAMPSASAFLGLCFHGCSLWFLDPTNVTFVARPSVIAKLIP